MNKVVIIVQDRKFLKLGKTLKKVALKLLRLTGKKQKALEIYLVAEKFMKTSVLSYPAPSGFPRPDFSGQFLGEIYLNPDYIRRRGEDIFFMLVHGFLHLLGYNHKKKSDSIRMERKEEELLSKISNS